MERERGERGKGDDDGGGGVGMPPLSHPLFFPALPAVGCACIVLQRRHSHTHTVGIYIYPWGNGIEARPKVCAVSVALIES